MPFALGYPLLSLDLLGTKIDASVWKGIWKWQWRDIPILHL